MFERRRMRNRLPVVLSATALVVALFGSTPVGHAVVSVAFARNADKVDGFHASGTPRPHKLVALNGSANLPRGALPTGTLRGAQVVEEFTGSSATAHKSMEVKCPVGKVALGGGYLLSGKLADGSSPVVRGSMPAYGADEDGYSEREPFGWSVSATEDPISSDPDDDWGVWAFAVCAAKQ
jgi:hypothetical protein